MRAAHRTVADSCRGPPLLNVDVRLYRHHVQVHTEVFFEIRLAACGTMQRHSTGAQKFAGDLRTVYVCAPYSPATCSAVHCTRQQQQQHRVCVQRDNSLRARNALGLCE